MATTDGSETTIPSPRTKTSVFAVPRSIARSWPPSRGQSRLRRGARAESTPAPPAPVSLPSAMWLATVVAGNHLGHRADRRGETDLYQGRPRKGRSGSS